jgi:hypothetical protein
MRREDVSLQDFRNYFEGKHRELTCQAAEELNATEFTQSLTLMVERNFMVMVRRGTEMPYDGVIEMWWENAADFDKVAETEEAQKKADAFFSQASEFFDLSKSRMFFTEQPKSCK